MQIRVAISADAKSISDLIQSLSQPFFTFPDGSGAELFLKSISKESIVKYIAAENFSYYVGEAEGRIIGVVAIRDNRHLYHLFVVASLQKKQLGRQLWEYAKRVAMSLGNPGEFTVNSSMNAVPVYEAFGFKATREALINSSPQAPVNAPS